MPVLRLLLVSSSHWPGRPRGRAERVAMAKGERSGGIRWNSILMIVERRIPNRNMEWTTKPRFESLTEGGTCFKVTVINKSLHRTANRLKQLLSHVPFSAF